MIKIKTTSRLIINCIRNLFKINFLINISSLLIKKKFIKSSLRKLNLKTIKILVKLIKIKYRKC